MALVLGYDTETTGLNVKQDYILEIGATIYDTVSKQTFKPLGELILWPARPIITPKITKITGITQNDIEKYGIPPEEAFGKLSRLANRCDYICAHNALLYDRPITETAVHRIHDPSDSLKKWFYNLKWLDTLTDLPFSDEIGSRKLKYCAGDHDYHMKNAHRAIHDVYACMYLLAFYPWELVLEINASPLQLQSVKCEWWEVEKHEELKSNGFHFDKPSKSWQRMERKYFSNKRTTQLSFKLDSCVDVDAANPQSSLEPSQLALAPLPATTQNHNAHLSTSAP